MKIKTVKENEIFDIIQYTGKNMQAICTFVEANFEMNLADGSLVKIIDKLSMIEDPFVVNIGNYIAILEDYVVCKKVGIITEEVFNDLLKNEAIEIIED